MADFSFWAAAGGMCFVVGALLLRAMAAGGAAAGGAADSGDAPAKALALYTDQLGEIDRDVARGTLAGAEAGALRSEVQRRMLDAARRGKIRGQLHAADTGAAPRGQWLGMAIVMAALAGAAGLYLRLGAPAYPDLPLSKRLALADAAYAARPSQTEAEAAAPASPAAQVDADFAALVQQLRDAVAARPDDVQGLTLLAQNEGNLGNFAASARAYAALIAAKGDLASADDHLGAAQAMIAAANGVVTPQAEAALMQTLRLDPENGMARYFSGLMFAQTGRPDRAFALWEPLVRQSPIAAPWSGPIAQLLPQVADAAGIRYTPPAPFGPDAGDIAGAADMAPEDRAVMIATMVAGLEERLLSTGGSAEEWARLITSLGVLGEAGRLKTAIAAATAALADDAAGLKLVLDAAKPADLQP